jgi:hypothetical protein
MFHMLSRCPRTVFNNFSFRRLLLSLLQTALYLYIVLVLSLIICQQPMALAGDREIVKQVTLPLDAKTAKCVKLYHLRESPVGRTYEPALTPVNLPEAEMEVFRKSRKIVENLYKDKCDDMNIGWYDINSDGVPDIFILNTNKDCGAPGYCPFHILVSRKNGEWKEIFKRQLLDPPCVLSSKQLGYSDLTTSYDMPEKDFYSYAINRFDGVEYSALYHRQQQRQKGIYISSTWMNPYYGRGYNITRLLDLK